MKTLPPASDDDVKCVFRPLSAFSKINVEPVGRWYEALCTRKQRGHTLSLHSLESSSSEEDEPSSGGEEEEDVEYLRSLDPKDWKNQDHYAVLGLKSKRHNATEDDLKKAYRKKVLRHHPDKRRNKGENIKDLDHDYFSCITKSYEILGNPIKRKSYDSVDPEFDDDIPSVNAYTKEHFFEQFGPVFEANSRWSNKKPVPLLGDENSSFEDVNTFYQFWYDFDSWREFSYLDEEEKEKGENREERRWIEKQNKAARQRRKKEEMARIRQLVDNAYNCDPRIQRFKEQERQKKLAQKKAKQEALRARAEEEEKRKQDALEAERKAKEKEEEDAKAQREKERKEKEALKKQLRKERRCLQQHCEDFNYFATDEVEKVNHLQEVDKLCKLLPLERLQALNKVLQESDKVKAKEAFFTEVNILNEQLAKEKEKLISASQKSSASSSEMKNMLQWSHDDTQLLIKGVNLFPAGTEKRWEVVAAFVTQHTSSGIERTAKEVLAKAKSLQKLDPSVKDEVNKKAYEKLEKSQKPATVAAKDESAPSERFESPAEQQGLNPAPWTADEQKLLEQALKTYPASTLDRWDRIAECLPGRSKKDCMKRYKDLVEMVKAKKSAQAAALKGKK